MKNKYLYFIKFLQEVRVSYKKYIGEKSLYLLNCYLNGYCYNIEWKDSILSFEGSDSEIKNTQSLYFDITEIREFFFAFQSWIGQKYLCQWQSWSNIIRFHCDNEEDAFETFYNELELFCESATIIERKKVNIIDEDFAHYGLGKVQVYGHNIGVVTFKKDQFNSEFYQKLWKLLNMIKYAPVAFIGEKSLSLTNIYICGYIDAYNLRCQKETLYEFFPGFETWVNQKVELNLYRPWYKVILFICITEEEAFDLFFDYLEEYTESKFEIL